MHCTPESPANNKFFCIHWAAILTHHHACRHTHTTKFIALPAKIQFTPAVCLMPWTQQSNLFICYFGSEGCTIKLSLAAKGSAVQKRSRYIAETLESHFLIFIMTLWAPSDLDIDGCQLIFCRTLWKFSTLWLRMMSPPYPGWLKKKKRFSLYKMWTHINT